MKTWLLFGFVTVCFVLLGVAGREQAVTLQRVVYNICITRNQSVATINEQDAKLYAIEAHNPFINEKVRKERLAIYGVHYRRADCGRPARFW